jgi:hypothetical protein
MSALSLAGLPAGAVRLAPGASLMLNNLVVMNAQPMAEVLGGPSTNSCAAFTDPSGLGQVTFPLWGFGGTCRAAEQLVLTRISVLLPSAEFRLMKELVLQGTTRYTMSQQVGRAHVGHVKRMTCLFTVLRGVSSWHRLLRGGIMASAFPSMCTAGTRPLVLHLTVV